MIKNLSFVQPWHSRSLLWSQKPASRNHDSLSPSDKCKCYITSKWLSSFRFSNCHIPSTNSLTPPGPPHRFSDERPNWRRTQLKKYCYVIFHVSFSLVSFSHAPYPALSALTRYKNFQPDKPAPFKITLWRIRSYAMWCHFVWQTPTLRRILLAHQ
jgi:hypothetical protein